MKPEIEILTACLLVFEKTRDVISTCIDLPKAKDFAERNDTETGICWWVTWYSISPHGSRFEHSDYIAVDKLVTALAGDGYLCKPICDCDTVEECISVTNFRIKFLKQLISDYNA